MNNVKVVAFLPGNLAALMPTLSTDVRIGGDYAREIWEKHGLGPAALGLIQTMINDRWVTKSRPNQLDFLFVHDAGHPKHYILGIKAAKGGHETWVTTLHPTDEKETRRRLRRAKEKNQLLRAHKWRL